MFCINGNSSSSEAVPRKGIAEALQKSSLEVIDLPLITSMSNTHSSKWGSGRQKWKCAGNIWWRFHIPSSKIKGSWAGKPPGRIWKMGSVILHVQKQVSNSYLLHTNCDHKCLLSFPLLPLCRQNPDTVPAHLVQYMVAISHWARGANEDNKQVVLEIVISFISLLLIMFFLFFFLEGKGGIYKSCINHSNPVRSVKLGQCHPRNFTTQHWFKPEILSTRPCCTMHNSYVSLFTSSL